MTASAEGTLEDWQFVVSADGAELLAWLDTCGLGEFALAQRLRERTTPARAALLTLTRQLRQKAAGKFTRGGEMFFTRSALEQASAEVVSAHRARRFRDAGARCVADLCCGAGGDALALAEQGQVLAVDRDPVRLLLAEANLRVYGRAEHLVLRQADVTALEPGSLGADAFFIDPARRTGDGERIFDPQEYQPPLSEIMRWRQNIPVGGAKLGPGVELSRLPEDGEVEFISVAGELREAAFWFGALGAPGKISASVFVPGKETPERLTGPEPGVSCGQIGQWLFEPDSAVIRAGLIRKVGTLLQARQIDPQIAFLSGDTPPPPDFAFARGWRVEDWFPYDERVLKRKLREREAGNLYLKKRGMPVELEALRKRLKGPGKRSRLVVLTRLMDRPVAILCHLS